MPTMMAGMRRLALLGVFVVGCGAAGTDGGGGGSPTTHSIDEGSGLRRVTSGSRLYIGPFTVPAGATVTYSIADMPTGAGSDTMDFVVAAHSMASNPTSVQLQGYGVENNVSSVSTTTAALPAGSYDVFCTCANLVDECFFTDTISALY